MIRSCPWQGTRTTRRRLMPPWSRRWRPGTGKRSPRLYERHAGVLLGLALRIVRDRREAEDLLHDVFLEAWRAAKDFDPKRGRVRTWLAIRMRSRALDLQKSARVVPQRGRRPGSTRSSTSASVASPDHARVRAALAELGPDQRRVLELAYFEGAVVLGDRRARRDPDRDREVAPRRRARAAARRPLPRARAAVTDIRALLPLYALGVLEPDEAAAGRARGRRRSRAGRRARRLRGQRPRAGRASGAAARRSGPG